MSNCLYRYCLPAMMAVACKPQNSADIVIASHHVGETVTDSCLVGQLVFGFQAFNNSLF